MFGETLLLWIACRCRATEAINPEKIFLPLENASLVTQENLQDAAEEMEKRSNAIIRNIRDNPSSGCEPDYFAVCPVHWVQASDYAGNSECTAPVDYSGVCKHRQSFADMDELKKGSLAEQCDFKWPCLSDTDTCAEDFTGCPEGFYSKDDLCYPNPTIYEGSCLKAVAFKGQSNTNKREWGRKCGTKWPCLTKESSEESEKSLSVCPIGWKDVGGKTCKGKSQFVGCVGEINFQFWTNQMKRQFAVECGVNWSKTHPCEGTTDYSLECPEGWSHDKEKRLCISNASTMTSCGILSIGEFKTKESKITFEKDCGAQWPCIEDACTSGRQWITAPCPILWELDLNNECVPLEQQQREDDVCGVITNFSLYNNEQRRKWASTCHFPWPCTNDEMDKKERQERLKLVSRHQTVNDLFELSVCCERTHKLIGRIDS